MRRKTPWIALAAAVLMVALRCEPPPAVHAIHVKLAPGAGALSLGQLDQVLEVTPLFPRSQAALAADRAQATARIGSPAPDLGAWYRVAFIGSDDDARNLAAALPADPAVDKALIAPVAELASASVRDRDFCPIKTPSYRDYQGYLHAAPFGIDVREAWKLPGGRGADVYFADVEGGWNNKHEDLPVERMEHVGGKPVRGWQPHGTAVLGVMAGTDNDIGVTGIAPDMAKIVTSSIGGIGPAAAIDAAQARLRPGDVLLIELHAIGPRGVYVPMEFFDDVYDAVRLATDRGIVVVGAAGNGGENLDHPDYGGKMDPAVRDSGAILVGAGAPPRRGYTNLSRLDFSNYGKRVDVQGWGRMVATLDYGDLQRCAGDDRTYTGVFSGTSSASPVVAGAAVVLQGIQKAASGVPFGPRQLRTLLRENGTAQVDGPDGAATQRIGPRPDLAKAVRALEDR